MTQCTPTRELVDRIGDATSRRADRLHDALGLPKTAAVRWAHDQRADECRYRMPEDYLGPQKRKLHETLSAFTVILRAYEAEKRS